MKVATPVFDGIPEEKIHVLLQDAKRHRVEEMGWRVDAKGKVRDEESRDRTEGFVIEDGKTRLYDGRTGDSFAQRVVVGYIYMLKLDHLVVNKIHARPLVPIPSSPSSRWAERLSTAASAFGEMEVWALEAYGAAHTLQEMLTVKSDDVVGRTRIYESIMRVTIRSRPGFLSPSTC